MKRVRQQIIRQLKNLERIKNDLNMIRRTSKRPNSTGRRNTPYYGPTELINLITPFFSDSRTWRQGREIDVFVSIFEQEVFLYVETCIAKSTERFDMFRKHSNTSGNLV